MDHCDDTVDFCGEGLLFQVIFLWPPLILFCLPQPFGPTAFFASVIASLALWLWYMLLVYEIALGLAKFKPGGIRARVVTAPLHALAVSIAGSMALAGSLCIAGFGIWLY